MIDPVCRREDNVVVARLAKIGGLDMRRVLPGCGRAIVAAEAVSGDVCVIEVGGHPASRGVAIVTGVSAGDMRRVLANRDGTVVTAGAGANDLGVINHIRRYEEGRVVAVLAGVGRQYMGNRFARCIHTVMAANAVARDARMVKESRHPAVSLVTVFALIG